MNHRQKMIAPVIVTICVVIYYILYFSMLIYYLEGVWKYVFGLIPAGFAITMIFTLKERIKEIKGGEEDDLSKY